MNVRTLAKLFAERPRTVVLVFTILTVLIGLQAQNLYMVSDYTEYLPRDDPTLELWQKINDEFNFGSTIIIFVNQTGRADNDVRNYAVLKEMDDIYKVLVENPARTGEKTGIASFRSLSLLIRRENSKPDILPVEKGGGNSLYSIPLDQKDIYQYMGRTSIKAMRGVLYTKDFRYTAIIIQLAEDADYEKVLENVQSAIDGRGTTHTDMTITGTVAMQRAIQQNTMQNIVIIFPLVILFVSMVLFFFHRSVKGIIIAFLPPVFALALTFGVLGIVAPQLTVISVAIVALLIALGVDYSIHLMNRFADEKDIQNDVDKIEKILRSTGKAVLLSTITTVIGFGSLMLSSMSPMVMFGFGCAIGILLCFISAIVLVPCFCLILNFKKTGVIPKWTSFANFAIKNRYRIILVAIFFAIMSVILIPQVTTDVNYYDMAPEGLPEVEAMFEYSEKFGQGGNFNAFLIETDPGGLEDPEVIKAIYDMQEKMRAKAQGATISSIADTIIEYYEIINRNVIMEKLANLTDADNIIFDQIAREGIVNKDRSKTIVVVSLIPGMSMQNIQRTIDELNHIAATTNLPRDGKVSQLTGQDAVYVSVNQKLSDEQVRSMAIALLLVLAVLILIFNSSLYGFLTMMPVAFVLMWEPGFLVLTDISLSPITITIASIMIGIGIDYGVHITHRIREELANGVPKRNATKIAIEKTGLSLLEAALTTIFGMVSIFFIGVTALNEFVIVIIFMTAMSCIAAALILPAFYESRFIK
jgi:uncharacterized protein